MKYPLFSRWVTLGTALLLGAIAPALLASRASQSNTTVRLRDDNRTLLIRSGRDRITLTPDDFEVRVLNGLNCEAADLEPEQRMTGQRFFPAPAVDPQTGNVAVGVLLDECFETQVSAVFVVDPQGSGYALYRVSVPGPNPLPDEFSTFPLNSITGLGYLNNELLIQQGDASGTEALLVFSTGQFPAGEYRGCIYTEEGESQRLCPQL